MTLTRILWGVMITLILVVIALLAMWNIPAPSVRIEKILPPSKMSE